MRNNFSAFLLSSVLITLAGCAGMPALNNLPTGRGGLGGLIPGSSSSTSDAIAAITKSSTEAFKEFSDAEEIALGEQLMSAVLGAAPLYDSDRIQRYVNQVGRVIASRSERPNLPWRFAVLDSPLANAGAAPGGQIYITTGLLFRMRSEAELAGALAHEIAHVVQKHQLKAYQKKLKGNAIFAIGGAVVDAKAKTGAIGKEVIKLGIGEARSMILLSLDRDEEYQADRMAMVLAARAGYDPYGLPTVIQILQDISAEQSGLSLLYSTHPTPADRLQSLDRNLGKTMESYSGQATLRDRFAMMILGSVPKTATGSEPSRKVPTTKAAPVKP
jgi:beta-barrel assembly-enhancing protease